MKNRPYLCHMFFKQNMESKDFIKELFETMHLKVNFEVPPPLIDTSIYPPHTRYETTRSYAMCHTCGAYFMYQKIELFGEKTFTYEDFTQIESFDFGESLDKACPSVNELILARYSSISVDDHLHACIIIYPEDSGLPAKCIQMISK